MAEAASPERFIIYFLACCLVALAACIPAKTPPQLGATAAAPVVVADDSYDAGAFRVRFPGGWRVITSPAGAPPSVIFAAPDNCTLIAVSAEPMDAPRPANCADSAAVFRREARTLTSGGAAIHAALIAPASAWDAAEMTFARVAQSAQIEAAPALPSPTPGSERLAAKT